MAESKITIDDTGWINANSSLGTVYYRRKNGVCYIQNSTSLSITVGQYTTLFTLPNGFRPAREVYKVVGGMNVDTVYTVRIQPNGKVAVTNQVGTNANCWQFEISFAIN